MPRSLRCGLRIGAIQGCQSRKISECINSLQWWQQAQRLWKRGCLWRRLGDGVGCKRGEPPFEGAGWVRQSGGAPAAVGSEADDAQGCQMHSASAVAHLGRSAAGEAGAPGKLPSGARQTAPLVLLTFSTALCDLIKPRCALPALERHRVTLRLPSRHHHTSPGCSLVLALAKGTRTISVRACNSLT